LFKKKSDFFSAVIFFQFLVIKALDPDWIRIRIGIQPKMLDPDPDEMNADPQPWFIDGDSQSCDIFDQLCELLPSNLLSG
jgi:hypothetical protein